MKKKAKVLMLMTIVGSLLSGCSFFETKIKYEPFVKALDEGDMTKVMSASDDGYAHLEERVIYSAFEEKEDGIHEKISIKPLMEYITLKEKTYMVVQRK